MPTSAGSQGKREYELYRGRNLGVALAVLLIAALATAPAAAGPVDPNEGYELYDSAWRLGIASQDAHLDPYFQHLEDAGFTGVWFSLLATYDNNFPGGDGMAATNSHGHAFGSFDDPNEGYLQHIDHILDAAADHGLQVGLVVAWANRYVGCGASLDYGGVCDGKTGPYNPGTTYRDYDPWDPGDAAPLNIGNAYDYGVLLAERWGEHPGLGAWVMGGDYFRAQPTVRDTEPVWQEVVRGIDAAAADGGYVTKPITYFTVGDLTVFAGSDWVDFLSPGPGHCQDAAATQAALSGLASFGKPVISAEMRYEEWTPGHCPDWGPVSSEDVEADALATRDAGGAGQLFGHKDRWAWSMGWNTIQSSFGSPGEQLVVAVANSVADPNNRAPNANGDSMTVAEGGTATALAGGQASVLWNDSDPDDNPLTAFVVNPPTHAADFELTGAGTFAYTHDGSETASDSFTYRVSDGFLTDTATVVITVTPVNDPPTLAVGAVAVDRDKSVTFIPTVSDLDSASVSLSVGEPPQHGEAEINGMAVTYRHDGTLTTSDSFELMASDGSLVTSAVVAVTVMNGAPIATADEVEVGWLESVNIDVVANDIDPDGDTLTPTVVAGAAYGTVTVENDGTVTYRQDGRRVAADGFTYFAADGLDRSEAVTVDITIELPPARVVKVLGSGHWDLYDSDGAVVTSFYFGAPGDTPIFGDWDCDGVDTPGAYRQSDGFVYLRNSNTTGPGEVKFFLGNPGDIPLVGDFNGDGCDTVSVYRSSQGRAYVANALGADGGFFSADFGYFFGDPGDVPFVGDFDGDGMATVGLRRPTTGFVYFRNSLSTGMADSSFFYGDPGDVILAGDWNADGADSVAIYRPADDAFYFRYSNTLGTADAVLRMGGPSGSPVAGFFS